ncbi:transposase [Bradyrhizobium sp.]|uniref:transposase n=1 Tax=Bradyrhizobium sp. TaxID=376 RepID=UPI00345CF97B
MRNGHPADPRRCRPTCRVVSAIANSRLVALGERGVTSSCKECRIEGLARYERMTLTIFEFILHFLIHICQRACVASNTAACSPGGER